MLGSHGDAFSFEEVFGERYWYPHSAPAAALLAERNNRALQQKVPYVLSTVLVGSLFPLMGFIVVVML